MLKAFCSDSYANFASSPSSIEAFCTAATWFTSKINLFLPPRLTNSFYLYEWSQEVSLSKNVKAWTLRATRHEFSRHQQSNDSLLYALWVVPLLEVMQSGMVISNLSEIFITPKDIGSGLKMCLAGAERDYASSVHMTLFTLRCLLMIIIAISSRRFANHGCFYDEVVPSALDLTSADEKGEKKTVLPKSTHNPLGDITTHKRWSIAEETLFEKLCIEGNLKEEVYLAAYLACWLCTFVLPSKDVNSIRPSTFKMASMMENGRRVSLAIPVLASIYEGPSGLLIIAMPKSLIMITSSQFIRVISLSVKLEDEIQSIDASEESETSHSWTTTPPPFGMGLKGKQLPQPPAMSVLEARSLSSQKLSRSLHEQHLKEAKARLQDVQAKASEGASKVQSIVDELEHVEKEIVALKG
ncbi:UNVERIFIED_CONTAM: hypothetical protein Slati_0112800 [Sesamum latifolium]|uniref:Aminotransferase-like plant mobile domain-containing protein n=1 Tax=Sesamum latifolium TaxID=2727402 RepID=A0AAW2Y910_9LAMI